MIKEFEFYHGAALTRLLHESGQHIAVESFPTASNSSYILNKEIGLFLKYSKKECLHGDLALLKNIKMRCWK